MPQPPPFSAYQQAYQEQTYNPQFESNIQLRDTIVSFLNADMEVNLRATAVIPTTSSSSIS